MSALPLTKNLCRIPRNDCLASKITTAASLQFTKEKLGMLCYL